MELTELLNSVKVIQVTGEVQRKDITGIYYDSRKVAKNSVFAAIKGYKTDGHNFIMESISKGAAAVILENNSAVPDEIFMHRGIAKILVENSRRALAEISSAFYKNPSARMKVVGITGTNGKTTTSFMLKSVLENSGFRAGLLGTISNYIGRKKIPSKLTTPESNDLNEMLYEMHDSGCEYAVMEVSSHSLALYRTHGIQFSAGIFTNITSDHLDFHGNFENYLSAKKILFDGLDAESGAIINIDDQYGSNMVKDCKARKFTYGVVYNADARMKNILYDLSGTTFTIRWDDRDFNIGTSLIGDFNAYNAAAAFTAAASFGIEPQAIAEGISKTGYVPGRFEVIGRGAKKAVIDYSHTADSLAKALTALRKISGKRQIITVFGCGGNRDKSKRPVMGQVAATLSDRIVITSDNPRDEDPFSIIEDIKKGVAGTEYLVYEDREEAISEAVKISDEDAVILIAGKGHEDYQERNGIRLHFSDKEIVEKYLN